jgi:glycosyltransferase involved in cell wall biosynthesis
MDQVIPELPDSVRGDLYLVIAAYNEEGFIEDVVANLALYYPNVVVVDDGSSDQTGLRAAQAGAKVLKHVINRGQGAALQTGVEYALRQGAQYIVTFDADGQHSPESIPVLLAPILAGDAEIVLGSRFLEDSGSTIPLGRNLLLKAAVIFTRLFSGVRLSDTHNGLRAFSRRAASMLDIRLDRMAHASEIIDQVRCSGLKYTEVPVRVVYTDYSRTKGQRLGAAPRVLLEYLLGRFLP